MQQQHTKASNLAFFILPSERLVYYNPQINALQLDLNIKAQDYALNHDKTQIAVISSKCVKSFNTNDILNSKNTPLIPTLQSYFPKKIQCLTIDPQSRIVVSDKFGDIYQTPTYLNSNLGIPTFMKHISNHKNKREYIILGDDYCKLKIYNYLNMHQINAIWYIKNCIPLELIEINEEELILLVKYQDKQNLKHTYKLYQFNVGELENGDFNGKLIWSDKEEKLNNSEYHPCSVTYSQARKELYFLKLYDDRIQIASFNAPEQQKLLKQHKQYKQLLPEIVKQGNSIDGNFVSRQQNGQRQQFMLISYGKYYNIEDQSEQLQSKQPKWEEKEQNLKVCKINSKEFFIQWKLQ